MKEVKTSKEVKESAVVLSECRRPMKCCTSVDHHNVSSLALTLPHLQMTQDRDDLLALLNAHGQNFLASFSSLPEPTSQPKRKRRKLDTSDSEELGEKHTVSEDEWTGFQSHSSRSPSSEDEGSDDDDFNDSECRLVSDFSNL